jgi:hypothetical protein
MTVALEARHKPGADVAGDPGDEYVHHGRLPAESRGKCRAFRCGERKFPLFAAIFAATEIAAFSGMRDCKAGVKSALMPGDVS